jgi:hypothetical protein
MENGCKIGLQPSEADELDSAWTAGRQLEPVLGREAIRHTKGSVSTVLMLPTPTGWNGMECMHEADDATPAREAVVQRESWLAELAESSSERDPKTGRHDQNLNEHNSSLPPVKTANRTLLGLQLVATAE